MKTTIREMLTYFLFTSLPGLHLDSRFPKRKMSKKQKENLKDKILHEEAYIEFLKNALKSENYKANVSKEEYEKTKKKYDKAKFKLKILKEQG